MRKSSNFIKCLVIAGMLVVGSCKNAAAFLPLPPMPWDFTLDPTTNIGKALAGAQALYTQMETYKQMSVTEMGKRLKGVVLAKVKEYKEKKGENKAPGKGKIKGNTVLGISEGSLNEEELFNAYHKLFFAFPENGDAPQSTINSAYHQKAVEYKQDVAMDTYLVGRLTEDYLVEVDKAIQRLEACLQGIKEGNSCIFFGLKVAKIEAADPTGDDNNPGMLSATMNSYIVTVVYDRLLRIVEDLTAAEAQFRAAQQIDLVSPIMESETQSSADEYIDNKFRFAYSEQNTYRNADAIISTKDRSDYCKNSESPNCPKVNEDAAEIKNIDDMEIVGQLQPIDDLINQAIILHNMKASLPDYKSQYRKYLQKIKIHERTLDVLKQSDTCAVSFLGRHSPTGNGEALWYGGSKPAVSNKYETRKGISGDLIKTYDKISTEITIGTTDECDGFYEACPSGYKLDTSNSCPNNEKLFACVVDLFTGDGSDAKYDENISDLGDENHMRTTQNNHGEVRDTDGFLNSSDADTINTAHRKENELTWRIGYDKIMDLTNKGDLKFPLWNDQESLQADYMRLKYRNIGMIIKSTDEGIESFKVASALADRENITDDIAEKVIKAAAECETVEDAKIRAKSYCVGLSSLCLITDNEKGDITITSRSRNSDGDIYTVKTQTIHQQASLNSICEFKKTVNTFDPDKICLTVNCIVKNYFPKVLGREQADGAEALYNWAQSEGRIVAFNKLQDVIDLRKTQEKNMKIFIKERTDEIEREKNNLKIAISNMNADNKAISKAREIRNEAENELQRSKTRIKNIDTEISMLESRIKQISQYKKDKDQPKLQVDIDNMEKDIAALKKEKECLQGNTSEKTCAVTRNSTGTSYIPIPISEAKKQEQEAIIQSCEARLENYKAKIDELETKIAGLSEKFATDYIAKATADHKDLEDKNREFEEFVEPANGGGAAKRMRNKSNMVCYNPGLLGLGCASPKEPERIDSDNLQTTMEKILYGTNVTESVKSGINKKWFTPESFVSSLLTQAGVPSKIMLDGSFGIIGLGSGSVDVGTLAKKLKDAVVDNATSKIVNHIKTGDAIMKEEVDAAVAKVKAFTDKLNISGSDNKMPDSSIYAHENYLENGKITQDHNTLIGDLKTGKNAAILAQAGIELGKLFGIPSDTSTDDEYFVALPARGDGYRGQAATDDKAGHDYKAPKAPLNNIPPVREVFYFNAIDYDELPRACDDCSGSDRDKPSIVSLLDYKYKDSDGKPILDELGNIVEYMPEIWRYLLARPNLRNDGKYQQTFVERSMGDANLNELVENLLANKHIVNPKSSHYQAIIGRAGLYPCKLKGSNVYIDVDGGNGVSDIKYKTRISLPAGVSAVTCQEVVSNTISNECNTYDKTKKTGICNLLADHGNKDISDTQNSLSATSIPMYEKYSELGQFLTTNMKYRPLLKNTFEYLIKEENAKNNIERQRAETASFNKNIFGSFLNAVNMEYNARKNMEKGKEDMKEIISSICTQIHSFNQSVNGECSKTGDTVTCDVEVCSEYIMNNGGLASSPLDNNYEPDCKETASSFYNQLFCNLDRWKNEAVKEAQKKLEKVEKYSKKDKERVKERLDYIKDAISEDKLSSGITRGSLIADSEEIVVLQASMNGDDVNNLKIQASANRDALRDADEEGIKSMNNQSQNVAYCPIY